MDFEKFLELVQALGAHRVRYALVGGAAMAAHGLLRATEDIGLFVAADGLCSIDLISRLGTAFAIEDLEIEDVELEGVSVRVATPRTLYRMKKGTLRPIDQADAAALRQKFDLEEE